MSTDARARGPAPTCGACGQPIGGRNGHSYVDGVQVHSGSCYQRAVAAALAARRRPIGSIGSSGGDPAPPLDRSPMPMTEENVAALERDAAARRWVGRTLVPAAARRRRVGQCDGCGTPTPRRRDTLAVPGLGRFCSLTCATRANGDRIPEV